MFCSYHSFVSDSPRLRCWSHSSRSAAGKSSNSCTHMYQLMVSLPRLSLPPLKWKYFVQWSLKSSVSSQQTHLCFQISHSTFPINSLKDISPPTGAGYKTWLRHSACESSRHEPAVTEFDECWHWSRVLPCFIIKTVSGFLSQNK